jgi:hypothetical protein
MSDDLDIQVPVGSVKRKEKLRNLQLQDTDYMKVIMGSKEGRRTIWRILRTTEFFSTSFTGSSETFFKEGKRYIGRLIYEELNDICPELYVAMMNENRTPKEQHNV